MVVATAALLLAGRWALAALPAGDDSGRAPGASQASASRAPADRATPRPTQASAPTAKPTAKPTARPTAKPTAKPTPKPASPICEPFLGLACSLDAGRYRSSSFEPPLEFTVGKGWSTANSARDELELARDTGSLTYASAVTDLGTRGRGRGDAPTTARGLVDAFAATDGVTAKKPLAVHIGGHDGWSVDLTTTDRRVDLFRTSDGSTYRLDPGRTARLVALDIGGSTPLVMGIQPTEGHTLRQILDTADDVAASTRLR